MELIELLAKKIKGDDFKIDKNINFFYLFNIIISMSINLIRGNIKTFFIKKQSFIIMMGYKSKIIMKNKVKIGKSLNIGKNVVIDALSTKGVKIGNNVKIGDYTKIICTGSIKNIGIGFEIGDNCGIGEYCFFGAAGGIKIGNDVIMGQNIRFHSENHNYIDLNKPIRVQGVNAKGIEVGNDCWIGAGVCVLDGTRIGNGCVIAANSVVRGIIPDNVVIGGVPAKIIKKR